MSDIDDLEDLMGPPRAPSTYNVGRTAAKRARQRANREKRLDQASANARAKCSFYFRKPPGISKP